MRLCLLLIFCAVQIFGGSPSATAAPGRTTDAKQLALNTFDYTGVRLLPSFWQRQQDSILEYYLAVPTDDYLIGFRKRAGKPAPGHELGGWYSNDIFNSFGQIVSGLARLYAATGDARTKAKVDEMVAGFVGCIEPDGYHFYSRKTNAPHYEYDKFLCGLLDAWQYCHNEQARNAISPITDWAIKNLDPNPKYPQPRGEPNVEGYTLSENLYRAYMLTGEKKYKDFADHWAYWAFWDKFKTSAPVDLYKQPNGNIVPHYHAYSHVNTLSGLAAGYLVTSDTKYLSRSKNAYDYLRANQTYVTGGFGPVERMTNHEFLAQAIGRLHRHFETQCGSWAVFKLSKYLETITGDARYAAWPEQMMYNGIGGSIQMDADGGVQYFSDYCSRGGTKKNINPWSCCTGTRPQAAADYTDQVFLHDNRGVYVNLFVPAQLNAKLGNTTVGLKMTTDFPAENNVRIEVTDAPAGEFPISVRRPEWLVGKPTLRVNETTVSAVSTGHGWVTVSRQWQTGDVLEFDLPMALKWNAFNSDTAFPGAVTYGPVVLVWQTEEANPARGRSASELVSGLHRKPGKLEWSFEGDPSITVRPWYVVPAGEKYFLYLDPKAGPYVELDKAWHTNMRHHVAKEKGATANFKFNGTGVIFHWTKFDDAGIAQVKIDGNLQEPVDQYGPKRDVEAKTEFLGLKPGEHEIQVIATGNHRPESRDSFINIESFEVVGGK